MSWVRRRAISTTSSIGLPNDPKWKDTEFGSDDDHNSAPALYINSWYDISMGPNVTMFAHQVKKARRRALGTTRE